MKPIRVACGIIVHEDKILVTQRSESMILPLKWEFPGGKVQANESIEQCLLRELKKELGISVIVKKKLKASIYNYGEFIIKLIPFLVKFESGKIKLEEHKDAKWLSKNDLLALDWAAADVPVLQQVVALNIYE